jgi:hypothetical protein
MQKIILGTVIAAFGVLNVCAAFAQDMTLTSTEVADGATIKEAQVANVFGCMQCAPRAGQFYAAVLTVCRA